MASKSKPHLKPVTPQARALLHAKETSCRLTESISSSEDSGTDNDLDIDARKLKKQRKRKAKNQRRYYYRHQEAERTKARNRAVSRRQDKQMFEPDINCNDVISRGHSIAVDDSSIIITDTRNDGVSHGPSLPINSSVGTDISYIFITNSRTIELSGSLHNSHLLSDGDHYNFDKETARQRLAHIRRILSTMESQWGTVDRWGSGFMIDWNAIKSRGVEDIQEWFDLMMKRIHLGHQVQGCLGRVMEGEMPADVEEWRDLWVQAHQLTSTFNVGFLSLQYRLDLAAAQQLK